VPKDMIALIQAADRNDLVAAREWHRKLYPLCRDMLGLSTNPIPIKAAMKLLGRDTGEMRLPMTPLETAQEASLRKTLTAYGLL
jgi:4-hydroxy-tetrahydrodipicolinate synthase